MLNEEDLSQIRQLAGVTDERILDVVQRGLNAQDLIVLPYNTKRTDFSGGTNFCPNSDFGWSTLAATTAGITPADANPLNHEVYRVTRQVVDANIGTDHLKDVEADAWVPIWERTQGMAEIGRATEGDPNMDIAFELTNNWLVGNRKWYVRAALATLDDTPLPVGLRFFAGFWVKRTDLTEGWVEGGPFTTAYKVFGIPGTKHVQYKVIAKTDTGLSLESQVLDVTDAPDILSSDNYIQVSYAAAAGFIEFELYRKDVATGVIQQIIRVRDSASLTAYDTGQIGTDYNSFPTVDLSAFRAYAEVDIDAVSIDRQKTFHNLGIRIPGSFDTSLVAKTFLRLGVKSVTAINHQVLVDTIWASESFNTWSPSPFDTYPSPPSTTMTSAPPTTGTGTGDTPTGGGGTCVDIEHDIRLRYGWLRLGDADDAMNLTLDNGGDGNHLKFLIDGEVQQYLEFKFDSGLVIRSSLSERFIRSFEDTCGILATQLNVGDTLQGGCYEDRKLIQIISRSMITLPAGEHLKVRSVGLDPESANKFWAVGDAETGEYVYLHNRKEDDIFLLG